MTGFDAAQAAYDNATPDWLEDVDPDIDDEMCDQCGNQGVCPDCDPKRPWEL
jgi:hypothetical protein